MSDSGGPLRDFLTRHREGLLLTCILVASLLIISQQVKDETGMTYLKREGLTLMSPFQRGASALTHTTSGIWRDYFYLFGVRSENRRLKSEVNLLKGEVQFLREELYRAGRLVEFEQFKNETGFVGVAARVIGESPDPWVRTIVINRGSSDGIRTDMPVVTPEGLAGLVIEVAEGSSVVRLLVDRSSQVPVLVSRSRARAILEGENSGTCRMKYLDRTEDVRKGDSVTTSGLAGTYPRGIQVGTITQVIKKEHGLYQYAKLLPAAPINRLEDVLVLTRIEGMGDAE